MVTKLLLAVVGTTCLWGSAFAQDAKTVIANAQKALGDPKSITYSGSAKDVSFQQCGASSVSMTCQGTHDPVRPITGYVRVIDLAAPPSRHTGSTMNIGPGGSTTITPGTFFQQVTPQQADLSQPWGQSLELYLTPWGFLKRGRGEQRDRQQAQSRRQALHRSHVEPGGEGTVRQELRDQRVC